MTEHTCGKCNTEAESQWRIRLERDADEQSYRLCRGCWNDLSGRFAGVEAD